MRAVMIGEIEQDEEDGIGTHGIIGDVQPLGDGGMTMSELVIPYFAVTLSASAGYAYLALAKSEKFFDILFLATHGRWHGDFSASTKVVFIARIVLALALLGFFSVGFVTVANITSGILEGEVRSYVATGCGFITLSVAYLLYSNALMRLQLQDAKRSVTNNHQ